MDHDWTSQSTSPEPQPEPRPASGIRKTVVAAVIAGSILFGAGVGIALFGPSGAGAATDGTTTTVPGQSGTTVPGQAPAGHHCNHGQPNGSSGTDSTPSGTPSGFQM